MKTKTWRLPAALVAFAIALSACGDSGEQTSTDNGSAETTDAPTIELTVSEDTAAGHNLFIELTNFTITPENASTDPVAGEGHLHLYVDGERMMRFYNTAIHLAGLEPGEHTVAVEVSQNDHSPYEADGEPVRATATITVAESGHAHSHDAAVDFEGDNPPTIDITVTKDPKSGWNLTAATNQFVITPENVGSDPVDGEGHLHLYIDGKKVTRLYGNNWHIAELSEGSHTIEVELSHNDHSAYAIDGTLIRASATVEVSAEEAAGGGHSHGDGHDDHNDEGHSGDSSDAGIDPADADVVIEVAVADGDVVTEEGRYEIALGSTVAVMIEGDLTDQVHVHGYDVFTDLMPGMPAIATFVADIPGLFEVELEGAGTLLFEIQVS